MTNALTTGRRLGGWLLAAALAACGSEGTATDSPVPTPASAVEPGPSKADAPADTARAPVFRTNAACPAGASSGDPLVVATDRGAVRGKKDGDATAFLGIPFAAPPVGALRFHRPEDVACWTGVRDAQAYGAACPQRLTSASLPEGNEDCLFLNVWTPSAEPAKKRPVLFFVYGGVEVMGSSNQTIPGGVSGNTYDGKALATREDVVVVSFNYRLGPLGFLSHPGLDAENGGKPSGNWALMDAITALEWVSSNIARFGGDPARVMVFGESAGALNACALYASPLTKGLLSSVLMESGACDAAPVAYRQKQAAALADAQGCKGDANGVVACLRGRDAAALMPDVPGQVNFFDKERTSDPKSSWYLGWGPVIDGFVLPDSPLSMIRRGEQHHVPFAIGSNANETELFVPDVIHTCLDYTLDVQSRFGALSSEILTRYPCTAYLTPRQATVDWTTDAQFTCPARRIARAAAANQTEPVHRYWYTHVPSGTLGVMRSFHASELPFLFDTFRVANASVATPGEQTLTTHLEGYWARFAATGDPNGGGAPTWPAYTTGVESLVVLDEAIATTTKLKDEKCAFWDALVGP